MPDQGAMRAVDTCPVCRLDVAKDGAGRCAEHLDRRALRCRGSGWHVVKRIETPVREQVVERK